MRILLTGGAGFIGSHLADRSADRGHRLVVLDDLSTGRMEHLEGCRDRLRFQRGTVEDPDAVRRALAGVDFVAHLAATVGVDRVAADPATTFSVIEGGSNVVLEAAAAADVPMLLVSSSEVYGFEPRVPVREDAVPDRIDGNAPRVSYAHAKLAADQLAREHAAAGRPVLVVRPFNVIGPRQSADGGAVLPRFVRSAVLGEPLEVHGDGRQRRTFLDVRDFTDVLVDLIEAGDWSYDAVNVGGTEEISIGRLAQCVAERCDSRSEVRLVTPPTSRGGVEVQRRVPDLTRLDAMVAPRTVRHRVVDAIDGLIATHRQQLAGAGA